MPKTPAKNKFKSEAELIVTESQSSVDNIKSELQNIENVFNSLSELKAKFEKQMIQNSSLKAELEKLKSENERNKREVF